ncbi:MAG: gamma-glutamylcyclotransferase [Alphaproteobacteria bacterium]|nr:MAG: gamma-glutamylcyclotransferase [Alphaproteobacteria bacterium]
MSARFTHAFGYGSLVNAATHGWAVAPATLAGWRRRWRAGRGRRWAFLDVEPAPGTRIEGALVGIPDHGWDALAEREAAYDPHHTPPEALRPAPPAARVCLWVTRPEVTGGAAARAEAEAAILLSYLDTVIEGYLALFGAAGAARFWATTGGWERAVIDDRAAPIYRRATRPDAEVRRLVDDALAGLGIAPRPLPGAGRGA